MRIVALSDCHVGSVDADHERLHCFLSDLPEIADELVIVGDLFELWELSPNKIREKHQKIINVFEFICRRMPVHYVLGNHDRKYEKDPLVLGFKRIHSDEFKMGEIVFIHGHQFDGWLWTFIQRPLCSFNKWIKKLIGMSYNDVHNDGKKANDNLKRKVIRKYGNFKTIVCGHVHALEMSTSDGVAYVNCGDWKKRNSYVLIDGSGVTVHRY